MKKVLIIENFGSDFYNSRLPLSKYLISNGFQVYAFIPDDGYVDKISSEGVKVFSFEFERKNKGIVQLIDIIFRLYRIQKDNNFEIIHSFRFQPNILNVLTNLFSRRKIILHVTGLGIAFSVKSFSFLFYRFVTQIIFQLFFFRANFIVFQNDEDLGDLWFSSFYKPKTKVIYGSGVDTVKFDLKNFKRNRKIISNSNLEFVCVTRLLWEKGIFELVKAFEKLISEGSKVSLKVVGWADKDNPRSVSEEFINKYTNHIGISFTGRSDNIPFLLSQSDVFIYPTYYREGIPRAILEALSMSMPVITTNTPGCKLTVMDSINGFLVNAKSVEAISEAVKSILESDRQKMGIQSREMAVKNFGNEVVFRQMLNIYRNI